ncbi:MAG TPA: hypothetical protein PLP25_06460 [Candidatus Limiplasma sp.]|nr:hypothetical protein [Candidatus Limiplasma sp.]HPS81485.1 hypothetical protein [Candidatus Limiplasma sp.]
MKRTFAILLTLMMLIGATACAESTDAAAATETPDAAAVTQITFDETAAPYQGDWLTFDDDGFQIYLPTDWKEADITDDMKTAGTFYAATSADGAYAMTVSYSEENNVTTNEELAAQLTAAGYENVTQLDINGISVVGYDISAQDVSGMAFMDSNGGMVVFSFTPASNETFKPIGQAIISSLSPIETESDAAPDTTVDTAADTASDTAE